MRASRASLIAVLLAGACGGAAVPATRAGALQWTDRAFGEGHSTSHERLAVPFALDPQGTSGTVVVQGLLRTARARGARYLSDVAIALQLRRGDLPIECVSRIVLGPDAAAAVAALPAPPGSFEPPQVEARVIDHELRCESQPSLVVRSGEEISV